MVKDLVEAAEFALWEARNLLASACDQLEGTEREDPKHLKAALAFLAEAELEMMNHRRAAPGAGEESTRTG